MKSEMVVCAVCGSDRHRILFSAQDRLHGLPGKFTYVRCAHCGLVYMNPQVCKEDLGELYPPDYAPHVAGGKLAGRRSGGPVSASAWLDDFLRNEKFPAGLRPGLGEGSRVLDVGCGNGKFLAEANFKYGCRISGVDVSEAAVKAAKAGFGIEVVHGHLEDAKFPSDHFDFVTSWWYLEHVPDPLAALREMARILKPGGYCGIAVPNARSLAAMLFRNRWYHLDCPRHLCLYTPHSMRTLASRAGLQIREILYDKTPWGLIGSLAYMAGGGVGAPARWRRKFWLRQTLLPFTAFLGLAGMGDTLTAWARKPPLPAGKPE